MSPSTYPYADRFEIHRRLPEVGLSRDEVLSQLHTMAKEEDVFWEGGKVSGTMYCGDHDHYSFMNEAFGLFAHVNVLQRDICPSATKFEAEIISMVLDLHHGEAARATGDDPCGLVTSGGTGSIAHAILAYREHAAQTRGITRPNMIKPETAHPAFDKACHLFGVELRKAPVDPVTTQVDVDWVRDHIDDQTVALIGSACNYGYGTVDPISELSDLALERGTGLHVDGCLGGLILPFGQELGYDIPVFDYRLPGVTSISADTHKYGYAFKGSSVVSFRTKELRNAQYFYLTDWSGGKYTSPGMDGSRSGGIIAATWAAMVQIGHAGYLNYAQADLRDLIRHAGRRAPAPRTQDDGPSHLPLLLHLRRVRRLPHQRLHADQGLALQRPAVPQRVAHGGDPAADPGGRGRHVRHRPGRRRGLRHGARRRGSQVRGDLRRRGRRHDRRGGRVHPRRHGRHARLAIGDPRFMSGGAPTGWIAGCVASQAALLADIDGLTDEVGPWSVCAARLERGPPPHPPGPQRRQRGPAPRGRGAGRGAGPVRGRAERPRRRHRGRGRSRPAAELVADVSSSAAAVERVDGRPPPFGLGRPVPHRTRRGGDVTGRRVLPLARGGGPPR